MVHWALFKKNFFFLQIFTGVKMTQSWINDDIILRQTNFLNIIQTIYMYIYIYIHITQMFLKKYAAVWTHKSVKFHLWITFQTENWFSVLWETLFPAVCCFTLHIFVEWMKSFRYSAHTKMCTLCLWLHTHNQFLCSKWLFIRRVS